MDPPVKKTNLLIIRGLFPQDFAVVKPVNIRAADPKLAEEAPVYTEIPKKFTGVEQWIKYSNLRCWSCDQIPLDYPRFLPLNIEYNTKCPSQDKCDVEGNFCEWGCVVEYVMRRFDKDKQPNLLDDIAYFESKFTGFRRIKVIRPPDKTEMKQYCGNNGLTPKQWREKLRQNDRDYSLDHYKMEHFYERY